MPLFRRFLLVVALGVTVPAAHASPPDALAEGEPTQPKTAVLNVEGVSCAGCSARLRDVLGKVDGITAVRSGDSNKHLEVDFEAQRIEPKAIVEHVKKAGFECWVIAVRRRA